MHRRRWHRRGRLSVIFICGAVFCVARAGLPPRLHRALCGRHGSCAANSPATRGVIRKAAKRTQRAPSAPRPQNQGFNPQPPPASAPPPNQAYIHTNTTGTCLLYTSDAADDM
eukprot:6174548-Prymnesium_polylepis.2